MTPGTTNSSERTRLRAPLRVAALAVLASVVLTPGSVLTQTASATEPPLSGTAAGGQDAVDVAARYGDGSRYGIYRKGDRIGTHTLDFVTQGDALTVRVASDIRVTVLKIPVFRFDYLATEQWQGKQLQSVDVEVKENGDTTRLNLTSDGNGSLVAGADAEQSVPRLAFASNHWHAGALASDRLWNTLTGEASDVTVNVVGRDTLPATDSSSALPYTRYRYDGDIDAEAWYDDTGRWVGLAFSGEDGSRIEYRLEPAYR